MRDLSIMIDMLMHSCIRLRGEVCPDDDFKRDLSF